MEIDFEKSKAVPDLGEKFFSIADEAFIFDILRNKMYSNAILAVVREYCCNALDSMTEAGKQDVPITVSLPSYNDLYFKVKDTGVGISPDRIENIFIKYAESTKRKDNTQIGGFGLGSKSAFAYSDSFSIITNFDGVKYNYACFIDETRLGKLALLSSEETSDPNGTEIIIPVKSSDISNFAQTLNKVCKFWNVKPNVVNQSFRFDSFDKIYDGGSWFLANDTSSYAYNKYLYIILGNISYALSSNELVGISNAYKSNNFIGSLYLNFKVGELPLAANRESLQLDDKAKAKINDRIADAYESAYKISQDRINSNTNLYDAIATFSECTLFTKTASDFMWKSHNVSTDRSFYFRHIEFVKDPNTKKIKKTNKGYIDFYEKFADVKFYINDTAVDELSVSNVKDLFSEENPNRAVILNSSIKDSVALDKFIKDNSLEEFEIQKLSEVLDSIKERKQSTTKFIISQFLGGKFFQTSIADVKANAKKVVLCKLKRAYSGEKVIDHEKGSRLLHKVYSCNKDLVFYGVEVLNLDDKKLNKVFSNGFVWYEDFIKTGNYLSRDQYLEYKYIQDLYVNYRNIPIIGILQNIDITHLDDNSFIKRLLLKISDSKKLLESVSSDMIMFEEMNSNVTSQDMQNFILLNEKETAQSLLQTLMEKYPMILYANGVSTYNIQYVDPQFKTLTNYIKMVDLKNKDQNG